MSSTGWLRLVSGVVRRMPIKQAAVALIVALLLTTALIWTRGQAILLAPGGNCQHVVIASSDARYRWRKEVATAHTNCRPTLGSQLNPVGVNRAVRQANY